MIVFAHGKDDYGLVAFDAASGELNVEAGRRSAHVQLAAIGRTRGAAANPDARQSWRCGQSASTDGKLLWEYPTATKCRCRCCSRTSSAHDRLLVSVEPGVTLYEINSAGSEVALSVRWITNRLKPSFNDFVTQ